MYCYICYFICVLSFSLWYKFLIKRWDYERLQWFSCNLLWRNQMAMPHNSLNSSELYQSQLKIHHTYLFWYDFYHNRNSRAIRFSLSRIWGFMWFAAWFCVTGWKVPNASKALIFTTNSGNIHSNMQLHVQNVWILIYILDSTTCSWTSKKGIDDYQNVIFSLIGTISLCIVTICSRLCRQ